MRILAGDVGGTFTRLMLVQIRESDFTVLRQRDYASQKYPGLLPLVQEFLQGSAATDAPDRACFAVAGPVHDGRVKITNLPWHLDSASMEESLGIANVSLINDFQGVAYGIAHLQKKDFAVLQRGEEEVHGNRVVLGAGTGLGQCLMTWCGETYHVHATEGGHADFAPRNEQEIGLLSNLLQSQSRVSYEDLLSGRGLTAIHQHLCSIVNIDPAVNQETESADDAAGKISEKAKQGDAMARSAMQLFMSIYGAHAGDLALAIQASGGVYLAGGIARKNLQFTQSGEFMQAFLQKPPMTELLDRVPVRVVLNADVGLLGAAAFASRAGN